LNVIASIFMSGSAEGLAEEALERSLTRSSNTTWADVDTDEDEEEELFPDVAKVAVDLSDVPDEPPFTAILSDIPTDISLGYEVIADLFYDSTVIGFWPKEGDESQSVVSCYVEFSCKDSLQNALAKDSIAEVNDKAIRVEIAAPDERMNPKNAHQAHGHERDRTRPRSQDVRQDARWGRPGGGNDRGGYHDRSGPGSFHGGPRGGFGDRGGAGPGFDPRGGAGFHGGPRGGFVDRGPPGQGGFFNRGPQGPPFQDPRSPAGPGYDARGARGMPHNAPQGFDPRGPQPPGARGGFNDLRGGHGPTHGETRGGQGPRGGFDNRGSRGGYDGPGHLEIRPGPGHGLRDGRGFSTPGKYEATGDMRRSAPLPPGPPPPAHSGPGDQGPSSGPPQRKKLVLKPRTVTATEPSQESADEGEKPTKPNPFAGARANDPNKFFQKKEAEEKATKVIFLLSSAINLVHLPFNCSNLTCRPL